jgi:hypothetical protein
LAPERAVIDLPAAGLGCAVIAKGVFALCLLPVAALFGGWFDRPGTWPPGIGANDLGGGFIALISVLGILGSIYTATTGERIEVSRDGLAVRRRGLGWWWTFRRAAEQVTGVYVRSPEAGKNGGIDLGPPVRRVFVECGLFDVQAGWMLDDVQAQWLRDTLHHYLAGGDGRVQPRPDGTPSRDPLAPPTDLEECPYVIEGDTLVFPPERTPREVPRITLACLIPIGSILVLSLAVHWLFDTAPGRAWGPPPLWSGPVLGGVWLLAWGLERALRRSVYVLDLGRSVAVARLRFFGIPLRITSPSFSTLKTIEFGAVLGPNGPRFRLTFGGGGEGRLCETHRPEAAMAIGRDLAQRTGLELVVPAASKLTATPKGPAPAYTEAPPAPTTQEIFDLGYLRRGDRLYTRTGRVLENRLPSLGCTASPGISSCGLALAIPATVLTVLAFALAGGWSGAPLLFWAGVSVALTGVGLVAVGTRRRESVLDRASGTVQTGWRIAGIPFRASHPLAPYQGIGVTSPTLDGDADLQVFVVQLRRDDGPPLLLDVFRTAEEARRGAAAIAGFLALPLYDELAALRHLLATAPRS